MADAEQVVVTQADREAAASLDGEIGYYSSMGLLIRGGHRDQHRHVQAFARHRTAAAAEARREALEEDFLAQLRRVNTERYFAWVGGADDAGIMFDALELGGEVGELLNVVKKLEREERGWRGSRAGPDDFADEIGDVLICLDKLARRKGIDLAQVAARKFNATSDKVGLPHKLALTPAEEPRRG